MPVIDLPAYQRPGWNTFISFLWIGDGSCGCVDDSPSIIAQPCWGGEVSAEYQMEHCSEKRATLNGLDITNQPVILYWLLSSGIAYDIYVFVIAPNMALCINSYWKLQPKNYSRKKKTWYEILIASAIFWNSFLEVLCLHDECLQVLQKIPLNYCAFFACVNQSIIYYLNMSIAYADLTRIERGVLEKSTADHWGQNFS